MLLDLLVLIFGLPIIAVLIFSAWKRVRAITARIAEVQEENARNPQSPYAALAELFQEQNDPPKHPRK